jgi:hypothetical protein
MSNSSNRIGGSGAGVTRDFTSVSQTSEGAAARAGSAARNNNSGAPGGGKGRVERILSPDQSGMSLDRSAPRGTYLNILV